MKPYTCHVDVHARADKITEDTWGEWVAGLDGHSPAVGRGPTGLASVTLTVYAESLASATRDAIAVVTMVTSKNAVAVEAMPEEEADRRNGFDTMPELLSVSETADRLGITRQAVLQRIEAGTLAATRVGNQWAVPEPAVRS